MVSSDHDAETRAFPPLFKPSDVTALFARISHFLPRNETNSKDFAKKSLQ